MFAEAQAGPNEANRTLPVMLMPNGDRAIVELAKLRDYCLNGVHPEGRHKARVFRSALGLTGSDAEELRERLLAAARSETARATESDAFGERFIIDFTIERFGTKASVRSAWIVKTGEDTPRLTSCYVL